MAISKYFMLKLLFLVLPSVILKDKTKPEQKYSKSKISFGNKQEFKVALSYTWTLDILPI